MEPSPVKGKPQGRLLVSTTLDAKDELEEVRGFVSKYFACISGLNISIHLTSLYDRI